MLAVQSIRSKAYPMVAVLTGHCCSIDSRSLSTKVKKKKKGKNAQKTDDGGGGKDRITELLVRAYDAPAIEPPPASEEEMARRHEIGRNYVIGMFNQHNEIDHDINCKLRIKDHAVQMLPRNSYLKEEALKISDDDESNPPLWRHIPSDTPPIPGFDPSEFNLDDDFDK